MVETNEGLPILDEVQNNCWWMRQMKESITDGVRNNCWWMRPMKDYTYQMKYKTTVDGMRQIKESIPDGIRKKLLVDETNEGLPIRDVVQNNCWWKERWRNPYQMVYETTVDRWDKWRTTNTRWSTKQQLMDETDEVFHTRWCTKQLLMGETNVRTTHTR